MQCRGWRRGKGRAGASHLNHPGGVSCLQQRAEGETGTAPTPGDEEEGQAAEEFDEEMEVQPTEERLFVTPRETG